MRIQFVLKLLFLPIVFLGIHSAKAAEIILFEGAAITPVIVEIRPQFEKVSGHTLVRKPDVAPVLKRQIEAGQAFDVAILNPDHVDDLTKSGKILPDTRIDIARTGLGVGVRAGAPKPDISTVEAFRQALLSAKSVAHSSEGASGVYFTQILTRLGIADQMKPKLRPQTLRSPEAVGRGEAEIVVSNVPAIIDAKGVDFVGLVPDAVQVWITLTAGVSSAAKNPEPGRSLINFLTSASSAPAIKAKGMLPPVR